MRITSEQVAADYLRPLLAQLPIEVLCAVYVDDNRHVIGVKLRYDPASCAIESIRSILRDALRLDAKGILLACNHPSGDVAASKFDLAVMKGVTFVGKSLGIRLYDYLIFGEEIASLRELGLL